MSEGEGRPQGRYAAGMGSAMSLAFEFAGAVMLFWFAGRWVDGRLGSDPWGQVVGSLLGWVGGFLHVYYATVGRKKVVKAQKIAPPKAEAMNAESRAKGTSDVETEIDDDLHGSRI